MKAYLVLCGASLLVGSYFLFHGLWFVMVFAVLEMTAVAAAFIYMGRHATDREWVALNERELLVGRVHAEQVLQFKLNPFRTQVVLPQRREGLICLESEGHRVEVGRFLTEKKRQVFAQELQDKLVGYRLNF